MTRLRHRLRVLEALALLVVARALRRLVPMRRWARLLGSTGPAVTPTAPGPLTSREQRVAAAVGSAARRTGANCLEQAVATSLMLRVRGAPPVVVIGLDAADPGGVPHAWVVGPSGSVVVGGDPTGRYRAVSQFGRLGGGAAGNL